MTSDIHVGDTVTQSGAPPGQLYVVVDVQPPLAGGIIPRVLINEVDGKDLPFGVGADRLTVVAE